MFRFDIPIDIQQTNRPVPVVYTLQTKFQLCNNDQLFMMNPNNEKTDNNYDYKGAFTKGERNFVFFYHPVVLNSLSPAPFFKRNLDLFPITSPLQFFMTEKNPNYRIINFHQYAELTKLYQYYLANITSSFYI